LRIPAAHHLPITSFRQEWPFRETIRDTDLLILHHALRLGKLPSEAGQNPSAKPRLVHIPRKLRNFLMKTSPSGLLRHRLATALSITSRYRFAILAVPVALGGALAFASAMSPDAETEDPITSSKNLWLVGEYPIAIPEPSGLSLAADGKALWAVSDSNGHVYKMDLKGNVLASFDTGLRDLEGIAVIDSTTLAVLAEREREIAVFTTTGTLLRRGKINIPGSDNKGPEGLAHDKESGDFLTITENPGILIRINSDFKETFRMPLEFALDYSSISLDPITGKLWVMSDLSGTINVLDKNMVIETCFSTNIRQLEGVAIDHGNRHIYMVSDPLATLYVFGYSME